MYWCYYANTAVRYRWYVRTAASPCTRQSTVLDEWTRARAPVRCGAGVGVVCDRFAASSRHRRKLRERIGRQLQTLDPVVPHAGTVATTKQSAPQVSRFLCTASCQGTPRCPTRTATWLQLKRAPGSAARSMKISSADEDVLRQYRGTHCRFEEVDTGEPNCEMQSHLYRADELECRAGS